MAIVTELINVISFKGSLKPLKTLADGLESTIESGLKLYGVLTGAQAAVTAFTVATLDSVDSMAWLAKQTGMTIEEMQELQYAAEVSGSSSEDVMSSLTSLTNQIGDAAIHGSDAFNMLGISVRDSNGEVKNAADILEDVRGSFVGMGQMEKFSFASSIGIDRSLVQMLSESSEGMDTLRAKARALGVVTGEQGEATIKFNDALHTLNFGISSVQRQIALALAPEITNLSEGFTDLLLENKDFIKDGIKVTIEWLGNINEAINNTLDVMGSIIEKTIGWKAAMVAVGLVMAYALLPINATIIGIIALVAIVDDLKVAFEGGESVIADFFDKTFGWDLPRFMHDSVDLINMDLAELKRTLAVLEEEWNNSFIGKAGRVAGMLNPFNATQTITGLVKDAGNYLNRADPSVPRMTEYGGIGKSTTIIQNNKMDITAPDAFSAGTSVKGVLEHEVQQTLHQIGHGGR